MERTIAAAFLLIHAVMLVVLDLMLAMASFMVGMGGVAVLSESGLQNASMVFGFALLSGLIAASMLAWLLIEALFAVRALRGSPRSLLMVCIGSLALSVVLLPLTLLGCSVFGLAITVPMVLIAGIATAFAAMVPPEQKPFE